MPRRRVSAATQPAQTKRRRRLAKLRRRCRSGRRRAASAAPASSLRAIAPHARGRRKATARWAPASDGNRTAPGQGAYSNGLRTSAVAAWTTARSGRLRENSTSGTPSPSTARTSLRMKVSETTGNALSR